MRNANNAPHAGRTLGERVARYIVRRRRAEGYEPSVDARSNQAPARHRQLLHLTRATHTRHTAPTRCPRRTCTNLHRTSPYTLSASHTNLSPCSEQVQVQVSLALAHRTDFKARAHTSHTCTRLRLVGLAHAKPDVDPLARWPPPTRRWRASPPTTDRRHL